MSEDKRAVKRLRRATSGTFLLRIGAMGLSFGINVVLSRALGAEGFGLIALATSWVSIASIAGGLGFERSITRFVAAYRETTAWPLLHGAIRHATRNTTLCSLAVAVVMAAAVLLFPLAPGGSTLVFLLAFAQLPLMGLARVQQSAVRGLHQIALGQVPELFVRPLAVAVSVACWALVVQRHLSAVEASVAQLGAAALELAASTALLSWALRREAQPAARVFSERQTWTAAALATLAAAVLRIVLQRSPVLVLGAVSTTDQVALFHVASKCADLTAVGLSVLSASIGPVIAARHAVGDVSGLQGAVRDSVRLIGLGSLAVVAVLGLGAEVWLALFGEQFVPAANALRILALGQLVNAATGPVGSLLMFTGNERVTSWILALGVFLNVSLGAVLGGRYGAMGAAVAASIGTAVWNIVAAVVAYRLTGVDGTVWALLPRRKREGGSAPPQPVDQAPP